MPGSTDARPHRTHVQGVGSHICAVDTDTVTTMLQDLHELGAALRACEERSATTERALAQARQALRTTRQALAQSRAREKQARERVSRDALTGLPDRRALCAQTMPALTRRDAQEHGLCLLVIDLDDFSTLNGRVGRSAGDALLQVVGARLLHAVRSADHISRHGGGEFVCLLRELRREDHALAMARKLVAAVSAPCQIGNVKLQIGASAGIAMFPRDGQTVPALLAGADQAMLWAKSHSLHVALARQVSPEQDAANSLWLTASIPTSARTTP